MSKVVVESEPVLVVAIPVELFPSILQEELEELNTARRQLGFEQPVTVDQLWGNETFQLECVRLDDPHCWNLLPLVLYIFDSLTSREAVKKADSVTPPCPERSA